MKRYIIISLLFFMLLANTQTPDSANLIDSAKTLVTEKVDSFKDVKLKELNKLNRTVNSAQADLDSVTALLDSLKGTKKYKWKLAPVKLRDIEKITFKNGRRDINLFIYYKEIDGKYYFYKIVKK